MYPFSALSLAGEEVEETELLGLANNQQTIYCSNLSGNTIVQVYMIIVNVLIII